MFVKHDAYRPTFLGNAAFFQQREEQVFFLGVMTRIGKLAEKVRYPSRKVLGNRPIGFDQGDGLLQQIESTLDKVVLRHEPIDCFHGSTPVQAIKFKNASSAFFLVASSSTKRLMV